MQRRGVGTYMDHCNLTVYTDHEWLNATVECLLVEDDLRKIQQISRTKKTRYRTIDRRLEIVTRYYLSEISVDFDTFNQILILIIVT